MTIRFTDKYQWLHVYSTDREFMDLPHRLVWLGRVYICHRLTWHAKRRKWMTSYYWSECRCDEIRSAMTDGHPNPEGAEEHREQYGHYADCPQSPA